MKQHVAVFEFSDHYRQCRHIEELLSRFGISVSLFMDDASELCFHTPRSLRARLAWWAGMIAALFGHALRGDRIIVSTLKEHGSTVYVVTMTLVILACSLCTSVTIIFRDCRKKRGRRFLKVMKWFPLTRVVDSEIVFETLRDKYRVSGYVYPSPIVDAQESPRKNKPDSGLRIGICGIYDSKRRDYSLVAEMVDANLCPGVAFLLLGGVSGRVDDHFRTIFPDAKTNVYLGDGEFDELLRKVDVLLLLNRPKGPKDLESRTRTKGTGSVGDAFFCGRRIICEGSKERTGPNQERLFLFFERGDLPALVEMIQAIKRSEVSTSIDSEWRLSMQKYFLGVLMGVSSQGCHTRV